MRQANKYDMSDIARTDFSFNKFFVLLGFFLTMVLFAMLITSAAQAACRAGEMTELIKEAEVTTGNVLGEKKTLLLSARTRAHVIAVDEHSHTIEFYVIDDLAGHYVNAIGLSFENEPALACQTRAILVE